MFRIRRALDLLPLLCIISSFRLLGSIVIFGVHTLHLNESGILLCLFYRSYLYFTLLEEKTHALIQRVGVSAFQETLLLFDHSKDKRNTCTCLILDEFSQIVHLYRLVRSTRSLMENFPINSTLHTHILWFSGKPPSLRPVVNL